MHQSALLGLVAAVALSACSTTSLPLTQLEPVPVERVTWEQKPTAEAGILKIARDSGFTGHAARVMVTVDGKPAGEIRNRELLELRVDAGRVVITASAYAALGEEIRRPRSLEVTVKPGEETIVRIGFDEMMGGFSIWQDVAP